MDLKIEFNKLHSKLDAMSFRLSQYERRCEELAELKERVAEFDQEIYTVKDLANLLHMDVNTVRRSYIQTGKIAAHKTNAGYEITKQEYFRVAEIVKTRGKHYL